MYFQTMQISRYMQGLPLYLQPEDYTDVDFSPGIENHSLPKITGGEKNAESEKNAARNESRDFYKELRLSDWPSKWHGVPYSYTLEAYEMIGTRAVAKVKQWANRFWPRNELPTPTDLERVREYFDAMDELTKDPQWTGYDILKYVPSMPTLNRILPRNLRYNRLPPPQRRGMTKEEYYASVEAGEERIYIGDDEKQQEVIGRKQKNEQDEQDGPQQKRARRNSPIEFEDWASLNNDEGNGQKGDLLSVSVPQSGNFDDVSNQELRKYLHL